MILMYCINTFRSLGDQVNHCYMYQVFVNTLSTDINIMLSMLTLYSQVYVRNKEIFMVTFLTTSTSLPTIKNKLHRKMPE